MKKSKADPRKPPIEDLQGHVYQHELGDPDRAAQIDRMLEEWRKTPGKKRTRAKKARSPLRKKAAKKGSLLQPRRHSAYSRRRTARRRRNKNPDR
jgi:hypothetical protein